jgi:hypothetical protein
VKIHIAARINDEDVRGVLFVLASIERLGLISIALHISRSIFNVKPETPLHALRVLMEERCYNS